MKPFTESNNLLNDPPGLRKRLRDDGYLFFRSILPEDDVLDLRRQFLEILQEAGWLRSRANLMDGLTDHAPISDRDEEFYSVYARVQALEAFHGLKFHENIIPIMEAIFQEPVIPFPQTIGRIAFPNNPHGTPPHQDWVFAGGSMEAISCWAPLGDILPEVGGLKILAGSHKAGFLEPLPDPGPGGRSCDVDPSLEWVQSGFRCGDILLFKTLTVHAAATNHTPDVMRLSVDIHYTGESHVIAEDWRDSPIARYWERLPNLKTKTHPWFWETEEQ